MNHDLTPNSPRPTQLPHKLGYLRSVQNGHILTDWIRSIPNTVLQWPEREKRRIPWNAGSEVKEKLQFVFENELGEQNRCLVLPYR